MYISGGKGLYSLFYIYFFFSSIAYAKFTTVNIEKMDNLLTLSRNIVECSTFQQQQQEVGLITAATTTAVIASYALYKILFQNIYNDGCPVVPLNGSSEEYSKNPHAFVEKWTEKLGPVYRAHVFGRVI